MWYRDVLRVVAYVVLGFTAILIVPLCVAAYYEFIVASHEHPQPHSTLAFVKTLGLSLALGLFCLGCGWKAKGQLFRREAIAAVVFIWFLLPALAALPYYFSETVTNPFQCYFEAASGLTTTGSTILHPKKINPATKKEEPYVITWYGVRDTTYTFYGTVDPVYESNGKIVSEGVEAVGKGILFWRAFTQFLGGGGIIVLFVAILPILGFGGKVLFQAEVPGPIKDTLTPRIKETAISLWKIYILLNVAQVIALMATNREMPLFDAVATTFATLSTGGFSVRNASIASYQNAYTEWVIIFFMILGSINFALYYYVIKGKLFKLYDRELFLFFSMMFIACVLISWSLTGSERTASIESTETMPYSLNEAIRYGVFQLVSAHSTCGFSSANYDNWPYIAQSILLIAMYFGGMSGSTAAGIKIVRIQMLFLIAKNKVESMFRPENVRTLQMGDRTIEPNVAVWVLCFFLTITAVSVAGVFAYILNGVDIETAIGLVACMINDTGFSFRMAGPTQSCAFLTDFGLVVSVILMLLGRLEFFAILALLVPAFWKQNS